MELRRVADALLRSNASSPLSTFLTPSLLPRSSRAVTLSTRRAISTTQSKRAGFLRPQITTAATARTAPDNDTTTSTDRSSDSPPKTLSWASLGNERPQTSSGSSPYGLGGFGKYETRSRDFAMDGGNSATELLSAITEKERAVRRRSGRSFDISQMMDPSGASESPSTIALGAYDDLATLGHLTPPKPTKVPMRLNPTAGRSVTLTSGIDLGRGIRLLEQSCARNRIRRDFTKQRFHERPGLKRKRMKREGWRNRFADGFKAVVTRVKQLKKQGW